MLYAGQSRDFIESVSVYAVLLWTQKKQRPVSEFVWSPVCTSKKLLQVCWNE